MNRRQERRLRRMRRRTWPLIVGAVIIVLAAIMFARRSEHETSTGVLRQQFAHHFEAGQHEEALAAIDEVIARNQNDDVALNNRGSVLALMGRYDEAIADFDRVIESRPGYDVQHLEHPLTVAYLNRGRAKASLGRYDEARADLEAALEFALETDDRGRAAKAEELLASLDAH